MNVTELPGLLNLINCLIALFALIISLVMYGVMCWLARKGGGNKSKKVIKNYFIFLLFSSPTFLVLFCLSVYKIPYDLGLFHF